MTANDLKKFLAFGTGVGIEIGDDDLRVVVARVRPTGATVLGWTTIAGFRKRPASEWGTEYAEFLRQYGAGYLAALALLPRSDVIVRHLNFPGVTGKDLGAAIEFQIDSLHPFGEGEAQYAWAKLSGASDVLIGITRRDVIERYAELFAEAGVKVASISFSAAVLYSGPRLFGPAPSDGLLAFASDERELYGESEAHPVFSAAVEVPLERAIPLAAAELRLPADFEAKPLESILPPPVKKPEDCDLSRAALPYAAALAGACPRLALAANLLPPELRHASSRIMFVPTAVLAALLAVLLISMGVQGHMQERQRVEVIESETRKVAPLAEGVTAADKAINQMDARIRLLDAFRRRSADDLDAVKELTDLLKPPAWLTSLELNGDTLNIAGNVEQAAPLLRILDNSPRFRNSEFTIPIARGGKMEVFRIRAAREGVTR